MSNKLNSIVSAKTGNASGSAISSLKDEISKLKTELTSKAESDSVIKHISPTEINIGEPFKNLFPVNQELLARIMKSIQERGFDESQPLIVWENENLLIDGHTRLQAAIELNLQTIPVYYTKIDKISILEQTLAYQIDRRNMTDGDIFQAVKTLCAEGTNVPLPGKGKTKDRIAQLLGTNRGKIQKTMTILKRGKVLHHNYVTTGEQSINATYEILMRELSNELPEKVEEPVEGEGEEIEVSIEGQELDSEFKIFNNAIYLRENKLIEFTVKDSLQELHDRESRKRFLKVFNTLLSELLLQ